MNRTTQPKIIVVTGSYPDVGKGIFSSALGYLLKTYGYSVQMLKFDGYMNVSSGSMNPYHKQMDIAYSEEEVFVLQDGYEADADSGYYERFLHEPFYADSNITNGQLFKEIIDLSTAGDILNYRAMRSLLKKRVINEKFNKKDCIILEIGGTIGDKESEIMFDCLNLMRQQDDLKMFPIMLSPCFYEESAPGTELSFRSKNIRQAYEKLWRAGLAPKAIVLRQKNEKMLEEQDLEYIALETGLSRSGVFIDKNSDSIYDLPASLRAQKLPQLILDYFGLDSSRQEKQYIEEYSVALSNIKKKDVTKIAVFGKTMSCDTYVTLVEAIYHSAINNSINPEIVWLDDADDWKKSLEDCQALIVGEGINFLKEKDEALKLAYEKDLPTLALSFGTDLMMRSISGIKVEECGDNRPDVKNEALFTGEINQERLRISSIPHSEVARLISDKFDYTQSGDVILEITGKGKKYFFGALYHPEFKSHPMFPHSAFDNLMKEISKC